MPPEAWRNTTMMLPCLLQTVLVFQVPGVGPVRFGWPMPEVVLQQGLRLDGQAGAALQWRPLQDQPGPGHRIWCEIAVLGAHGRCVLAAGGDGPSRGAGPAFTLAEERDEGDQGFILRRVRSWRYCSAASDFGARPATSTGFRRTV